MHYKKGYSTYTNNRNNFLIGIVRGEILTRLLIKGHRFREIILLTVAMVSMTYNITHAFKHINVFVNAMYDSH